MRPIKHLKTAILVALCGLMACRDDTTAINLREDPLQGTIGGLEWEYTKGNGEYHALTNLVEGLIVASNADDPCAIRVTAQPHLGVRFPTIRGYYNLPFANNEGHVIFHLQGGGKQLTATSGFIQIVEFNSFEVVGYISADFDDENSVQGSFLLTICN